MTDPASIDYYNTLPSTRPQLVTQAYFKPENTRKTVPKAFSTLPKSKLKIGAFLVRLGANHTKYCITVLANDTNAFEETSYKHILVNQTPRKQYYICERDDEKDYVFSSLEELVQFYTKQTIGIHYHNMDFILNDVWSADLQIPDVGDLYLQPKVSVVKKGGNSQKNSQKNNSSPKPDQSTKNRAVTQSMFSFNAFASYIHIYRLCQAWESHLENFWNKCTPEYSEPTLTLQKIAKMSLNNE